jgi:uncharacterized protein (TIGR02246 family)
MRHLITLLAFFPLVLGASELPAQQSSYESAISESLQQMLDAWNRDDLDAHIAPYADSATWMTSNGLLRGRAAIRASLVKSFQRGTDLIGELRFSDTEFHPLDTNTVMTTGAFHLTNLPSGRDLNGRSTLIWVRRNSKWLIIHDHSS